jgi:hypothetical protein
MVVLRVPHRYPIRTDRPGYLLQESVAYLPCRFFRRKAVFLPVTGNVPRLDGRRYTQFPGKLRHVSGITFGILTAKTVVQVGHVQFDSQFRTEIIQNMQ